MLALFTVETTFPEWVDGCARPFPWEMLQKRSRPFGPKLLVTRSPSIHSVKVNRKASELTSILDRQIAESGPRREEATREAPTSKRGGSCNRRKLVVETRRF